MFVHMLTDGPDTDSRKMAFLYSFLEKPVSSSSSVICVIIWIICNVLKDNMVEQWGRRDGVHSGAWLWSGLRPS